MSIIGKFGPFSPGDPVPLRGTVVHFGVQNGALFVWAECELDANPSSYDTYQIVATGEPLEGRRHYKTVVEDNGLVWHLVR